MSPRGTSVPPFPPGYRASGVLLGPAAFAWVFLFGLTADEVRATQARGYKPRDIYRANVQLNDAVDLLTTGILSRGDRELFRPLVEALLDRDEYMVLTDYQAYVECAVSRRYSDRDHWTRTSTLNVARSGKFSSERVSPVHVEPDVGSRGDA